MTLSVTPPVFGNSMVVIWHYPLLKIPSFVSLKVGPTICTTASYHLGTSRLGLEQLLPPLFIGSSSVPGKASSIGLLSLLTIGY